MVTYHKSPIMEMGLILIIIFQCSNIANVKRSLSHCSPWHDLKYTFALAIIQLTYVNLRIFM